MASAAPAPKTKIDGANPPAPQLTPNFRVAPLSTRYAGPDAIVQLLRARTSSVPCWTKVVPVLVLAPLSTKVPAPVLTRETMPVPLLAMTELIVLEPASLYWITPLTLSAPPAVSVPPVKLMPAPAKTVPTAPRRSVLPVPMVTVAAAEAVFDIVLIDVVPAPTVTVPVVLPTSVIRTLLTALLAMTPPRRELSVKAV